MIKLNHIGESDKYIDISRGNEAENRFERKLCDWNGTKGKSMKVKVEVKKITFGIGIEGGSAISKIIYSDWKSTLIQMLIVLLLLKIIWNYT